MLRNEDIAVATTTFFQSTQDVRFQLTMKTLEALHAAGHHVVVVDGSKDQEVRSSLMKYAGALYVPDLGVGMGASRRLALKNAMLKDGSAAFVWMEPEKYPMVPFLPMLCKYLVEGPFDLVIPHRRSLRSYPRYQECSELRGNHELGSLTGRGDLDLFVGPRIMSARMADLFMSYNGSYGDRWESIFIPVAAALRLGWPVGSMTVDYVHPPEQTAAEVDSPEFNAKRDDQLDTLLKAMTAFWNEQPMLTI